MYSKKVRNLKLARLRFLEAKLELQNKQGVDVKEVHQTMRDIQRVRLELSE